MGQHSTYSANGCRLRRRNAALVAAAAFAIPSPASAQAFPDFDVAAACASNAQPQACRKLENEARGEAARKWSSASAARKEPCLKYARSVPGVTGGSYLALLGCLRGS